MRIAIVYDHNKEDAAQLATKIRDELRRLGHKAYFGLDSKTLSLIGMVITLGGDGLIMNVANRVVDYKIPLLRINFGHVGFMANIEPGEALAKIREVVAKKNYIIVKKTRLEVFAGKKDESDLVQNHLKKCEALNDIIIERSDTKIVTIALSVDGESYVFRCDGVIVCTKNGSTAYNVSAGRRPLFKEHFLGVGVVSPTAGASPDQLVQSDDAVFVAEVIGGSARLVADDKKICDMKDMKALIRRSEKYTYFIEVGDLPRLEE